MATRDMSRKAATGALSSPTDGRAGAAGIARHSHQHAGRHSRPTSTRRCCPGRRRRPVSPPTRKLAYDQLASFYKQGIGYAIQMGLRPQTLVRDRRFPGRPGRLPARPRRAQPRADRTRLRRAEPRVSRRDDVLDNVTLYWLTNTAVSSARLYWENASVGFFNPKGVTIPVAVSVFPDELYPAPRSWAERAYPKLIHYNRLDKGGHFAAWEQPELFTEELRAGFRSLRKSA